MSYFSINEFQRCLTESFSYFFFKILSAALEYMTTIGVLLGGEKNDTYNQMYEILEFETEIANVSWLSGIVEIIDRIPVEVR